MNTMKKKIKIFSTIIAILIAALAISLIVHYSRQIQIPDDLEHLLITDIGSRTEVGISTVYFPSILDKIIGENPYLFQVRRIEYFDGTSINSPTLEACLEVRMIYRDPSKASVYSFSSPTENFLYLVRKEDDNWNIQHIRQSTVNRTISNGSCTN